MSMKKNAAEFEELVSCLPCAPDYAWQWTELLKGALAPLFRDMAQTPQQRQWHGEGDVWAHTRMVCEALVRMPEFRRLDVRRQKELALAALLHDAGKIRCTRMEDGIWISRGHAAAGAQDVRRLLWQQFGLSGEKDKQCFRETVCLLIRWHTLPLHLLDAEQPERYARSIAANAELMPDFSLRMLCMLAEADVLGRICEDAQEQLDRIRLGAELAKEAGCYDGAYAFPSAHTRHAYLSGKKVWPEQALYDETWGEVILMCGLPGTGKDTWISANHSGLPVVCMDDIRRNMGVKPGDDQGQVVQAAQELARVHLRKKQPFIWNATCTTDLIRGKQIRLFEAYGASVRIVYLETAWQENLRRNAERRYAVPETVINHMLENLTPPLVEEAQSVEWICV